MRLLPVSGVMIGALALTTLGIDAADTLSGKNGTLLSQVIGGRSGEVCPRGMREVTAHPDIQCVDVYEASPAPDCPNRDPTHRRETEENIAAGCASVSQEDRTPWRYVTREQAAIACALSEKRLPSAQEWYALALGTPEREGACNTESGSVRRTGAHADCRSGAGAYDMIGNVWEWVRDDLVRGAYRGRDLPGDGYVSQVDAIGVATQVTSRPSSIYGNDYFWSKPTGVYGMIRGGFYGSGADAGLYAVHADTPPESARPAIGFRCIR